MSKALKATAVRNAVANYSFVHTKGRERVICAYEELLAAFDVRSQKHIEHGNDDLLNLTKDLAQSAMIDLERFCRKWQESDRRGQTY